MQLALDVRGDAGRRFSLDGALAEVLLAIPEEPAGRLLRVNVQNRRTLGAGWYLLGAEVIELLDQDEHQRWNRTDRELFHELGAW